MDLKWLEDFLSIAETRSFSRSADQRNVTQSALSRRIQALETWLGTALIDRSTYPTTLTQAGRSFRETAEEVVRMLHAQRADLQISNGTNNPRTITVAALHSLATSFFPKWLRQIEARTGYIASRLLPEDFHTCLQAIVEGGYDFLLTYHHPSFPVALDPELFPHRTIGSETLVAVRSSTLPTDQNVPMLSYAQNSFLGRMAATAQAASGLDVPTSTHVNVNSMAEALKWMTLEGHGYAWLPRSLVDREIDAGQLRITGEAMQMEIRLYRNAAHRRSVVVQVWQAADIDGD